MISNEECKKVLNAYNSKTNFEKFTIAKFDSVLGFLGDHSLLKIFYSESNIKKNTTFFLKTFPKPSKEHVDYIKKLGVFKKEALIYSNLINHFQTYFDEAFSPKIYLTDNKEFIILEDLNRLGYENFPGKSLDLTHMEAVLKSLAYLHASSIIFEEKRREVNKNYRLIDEFCDEFKEVSFSKNEEHPRNKWSKNVLKAVLDCIETIPQFKMYQETSKNLIQFTEKDLYELIKPSKKFRNTLTHCDLWSNNAMFRKTKNNLDCVLVDFQFARYIPPIYDVLLTMYLNLSYGDLNDNFKRLLDFYYECLQRCLEKHQTEIKMIMSYQEFWESVDFYKRLAVVEATWFGTIAFIGDDLAQKISLDKDVFEEFYYLNRSKHLLEEMKRNEEYNVKIIDLLRHIVILFS